MIKRRARQAGLPHTSCCHTFRPTGITTYLQNSGTIEHAQHIANHEPPRTTRLYDRTSDAIRLGEIARILVFGERSTMLTIRPEEAGFSSERLERIPRLMQRYVDRGDLAGALTRLARHGQVFRCATTGLMDKETP